MKLSEYVIYRMQETRGVKRHGLMLWTLWALLVKPGRFTVKDQGEEIELELNTGMLRLLLSSLLLIGAGVGRTIGAMVGVAALGTLVLLSPLWLPLIYLLSAVRAWRQVRRHRRQLAEARAGLTR